VVLGSVFRHHGAARAAATADAHGHDPVCPVPRGGDGRGVAFGILQVRYRDVAAGAADAARSADTDTHFDAGAGELRDHLTGVAATPAHRLGKDADGFVTPGADAAGV